MKPVKLSPEKRQELQNWLLENLLGKHCNPILQFLAENEEVETQSDPIGGGGSAGGPRPPKDE